MEQLQDFLGYAPANLLVPVLLFIILSPGMVLCVPPNDLDKRWFNQETSRCSIVVHAMIFIVVYYFLRLNFPEYY